MKQVPREALKTPFMEIHKDKSGTTSPNTEVGPAQA